MSVCLTFSLYLQKICVLHHNGILSNAPRFRRGTGSSSHYREVGKKNQGVSKYKGEPKYLKFKGGSGTPKHTMAVSLQPL